MAIECNTISQIVNELTLRFQDCNKIKNSDLRLLVELVAAVNTCANGGKHYDTLISEVYEPISNQLVTYPINSFHSISITVLRGTIEQDANGTTVTFPKNTSLNLEVTTLNQTPYIFTVTAGSQVLVEYIIETL